MPQIDLDQFGKQFEKEQKEREAGDFYKIQDGTQKMRILTPFEGVWTQNTRGNYAGIFTGTEKERNELSEEKFTNNKGKEVSVHKFSFRGWAWAIIRETGELKLVQFPKTILHQIYSLKNSEDYAFKDYPMPYDINISATGAGTTEVKYNTIPSNKITEVTPEELKQLNKKKAVSDVIGAIVDKQNGKKTDKEVDNYGGAVEYPTDDIKPSDIPF